MLGDQQGVVLVLLDQISYQLRRRGLAPFDIRAGDGRSIALGDRAESRSVTEGADGDAQHVVAGRERVDDGGLTSAAWYRTPR